MSDDQRLVDELHRTKEEAKEYFISNPPSGLPTAVEGPVLPVGEILFELVKNHPLFGKRGNRYFGARNHHMNPSQAATLLTQKSQTVGAEQAVAWLSRFYTAERADIRSVTEVLGLHTEDAYSVSNGVSFMPFSAVPYSPMTARYRQRPRGSIFDSFLPRTAAVFELKDCPVSADYPRRMQSDSVERAVCAHVLISEHSTPSVGVSWIEFCDLEMEEASPRVGVRVSRFDAPIGDAAGISVSITDIPRIELFLALDPKVLDVCEMAASRLITARSRLLPGNKAIDGCICLEALLTEVGETGENIYKIALRAALLIRADLVDRQNVFAEVKAFYDLRSRTVHGSRRARESDYATAANGVRLCAEVLQKIVELKKIPNWREMELGANSILSPISDMHSGEDKAGSR